MDKKKSVKSLNKNILMVFFVTLVLLVMMFSASVEAYELSEEDKKTLIKLNIIHNLLSEKKSLRRLENNETLAGVDVDDNGIRDDVDLYIETLNSSEYPKKAIISFAKKMQSIQNASRMNPEVAREISDASSGMVFCVMAFGKNGSNINEPMNKIESLTANTVERDKRYSEYNSGLDGTVISLPNYNECQEFL